MKKFMDVMFYLGTALMLVAAVIAVLMVIHNVDFIENIVITMVLSVATVAGASMAVSSVGYDAANEEHKNTNK